MRHDEKLIEFWKNELSLSDDLDRKFIESVNDVCEYPEWNRLENYDNLIFAYREMKNEIREGFCR